MHTCNDSKNLKETNTAMLFKYLCTESFSGLRAGHYFWKSVLLLNVITVSFKLVFFRFLPSLSVTDRHFKKKALARFGVKTITGKGF
jgi:hypothetical protein